MPQRRFLIVQTADQWLRSCHQQTDLRQGIVQLAETTDRVAPRPIGPSASPAGLAFDNECRLYHSTPEAQENQSSGLRPARIDRILWATLAFEERERRQADVHPLFAQPLEAQAGDFTTAATPGLRDPRGLAVDADDRLFVADARLRQVVIVDLECRRILRRIQFSAPGGEPARPIDLASCGRAVWVLLGDPPGLALLRARRPARRFELPAAAAIASPSRLAISKEGVLVVIDDRDAAARVVSFIPSRGAPTVTNEPFATDVEFDGDGALVIARRPGEEFLRYAQAERVERISSLKAADYDGAGIVRTPDGHIGYWMDRAQAFRQAVAARERFKPGGRVTTYRLDSGEYQTVWGRLFLDACLPADTDVRVRAIASDEPPEGPTQSHGLPENMREPKLLRPDLSPPLLPLELDVSRATDALFRRPNGRELPWAPRQADDPFETYEAPVRAERGRYLWITLELRGNGRRTPRIRSLRVEHPAHDCLRRLPMTFSRDAAAESFLRRFLAPLAGLLGEMEGRALARMVLVDARTAPAEVLPWLAGFIGLVLDERVSAERRRRLIAEAVPLLRFRGTVGGLRRFLEISIGIPVIIVEHFTLRGFGGPVLGYRAEDAPTRSVLGSGFRIGGATDTLEDRPLTGEPVAAARRRAHRFTVIVPGALSADQRGIVEHVLRLHRPAHTMAGFCTAGAGMRTGIGLHVGLSTVIGDTATFSSARLGDWTLGRGVTIGRAVAGTLPGAGQLGRDTRVG